MNLWNPEDSLLNYKVKRISDFFISLILIIFTSPILLLTSIAIKLTSEGPIIFKQSRYGYSFKTFQIIKFRTMHLNSGSKITQKNDMRITFIGNILRNLKLDELPQLINIIKGDSNYVLKQIDLNKID